MQEPGGGRVRSVDKLMETLSSQRIKINSCLQLLRNDPQRRSLTTLRLSVAFFFKLFSLLLFAEGVDLCVYSPGTAAGS